MADWSEIQEDLLVSIAKRLPTLIDYLYAGEVCKRWRSITLSLHNRLFHPQPPFLMLAEEEKLVPCRRFVALNGINKRYELHLPELHQNRCIGSTGNWLILVNKELELRMFNPFNRIQFNLPSQTTLPDQFPNEDGDWTQEAIRDTFLRKLVLSSTPKFLESELDSVLAICIYGARRKLAIAKPGDHSWMPIRYTHPAEMGVDDIIFFKNRFYFVNSCGDVAFYEIGATSSIEATNVCQEFKSPRSVEVDKYYLVELLGELLIVLKYCPHTGEDPYYQTQGFDVFRFNCENETWDEIKNLGQYSLFLGFSTSVSLVATTSSTFQENRIYFTDDDLCGYYGNEIEGGRDMGVFNLEDGKIKTHFAEISTSMYSPPLWIIPRSLY